MVPGLLTKETVMKALTLFFASFFFAGAALSQSLERSETLQVGAMYRYQFIDLWKKDEVVRTVTQKVKSVDGDVALLEIPEESGAVMKLDLKSHSFIRQDRQGVLENVRFLTQVGESWKYEVSYPNERRTGYITKSKNSAKFVGWEDVTVPAGTFRAAKIEHEGWYTLFEGGQGRQSNTVWYAPSIAKVVRDIYINYTPQGARIWRQEEWRLSQYLPAPQSTAATPQATPVQPQ